MQKNDFEKNVQHRMDELQVYPSAEIWPEVERRIRKEKKRRWVIFWLLFPLLLTGTGAAIYFLTKTNKKSISSYREQQVEQPITEKNKKDEWVNDQPVTPVLPKNSSEAGNAVLITNEVTAITKQSITETKKDPSLKKDQPVVLINSKNGAKGKTRPAERSNDIPADTVTILSAAPEPGVVKKDDSPSQVITDSSNRSFAKADQTKSVNDPVQADPSKPVVAIADSIAASNKTEPLAKNKTTKWKWGITAGTGLSNRGKGLALGAAQSNNFSTTVGATVPGFPAQTSFSGYDANKPGLFWEAGAYLQSDSKKKTSVSVGLSVSSFTYRQPTGPFRDSIISKDANGFYSYGNSLLYNNRYYYLQVPFMLHWQLSKRNKFPLVWQNGFSPSFLLASDALIYDKATNIYYRKKESLNKVQFALRSGLYTRFATTSKHPLSAGLFFNYNLSGLQNANEYNKNHLVSFGLQFMLQLKKD